MGSMTLMPIEMLVAGWKLHLAVTDFTFDNMTDRIEIAGFAFIPQVQIVFITSSTNLRGYIIGRSKHLHLLFVRSRHFRTHVYEPSCRASIETPLQISIIFMDCRTYLVYLV